MNVVAFGLETQLCSGEGGVGRWCCYKTENETHFE